MLHPPACQNLRDHLRRETGNYGLSMELYKLELTDLLYMQTRVTFLAFGQSIKVL